jgi:hypothetical protein
MSDTAVSVPSVPAPQPAGPSEVPINTTPNTTPAPLGSQAPQRQGAPADLKGSEHRPESRREAVQRSVRAAFERAEKAEPAKAKMGHNQPPEPMERERPKSPPPPKLDLKKPPSEQPKEAAPPREPQPRAEHGHYAARAQQPQQQPQPGPQLPQHAPYRDPPQRMDERAKADWHSTPESVRASVHRMHQDFGRAYQQYRGDSAYMDTIRHYANEAQKDGITLAHALERFTSMEHKLRNDPVGGLELIIDNLNLRTDQGQKVTLQDVAWHIVNQTPEQHKLMQAQNAQAAQNHQLRQANARIAQLEQQQAQMQWNAAYTRVRGGVDHYATTHPRLDELGDIIVNEINSGYDLDTAYRRANLLRPATHAAQTRNAAPQQRTAPAQTRHADRSIHGAPDGGLNGQRRRGEGVSRRESIAANARKVLGNGL